MSICRSVTAAEPQPMHSIPWPPLLRREAYPGRRHRPNDLAGTRADRTDSADIGGVTLQDPHFPNFPRDTSRLRPCTVQAGSWRNDLPGDARTGPGSSAQAQAEAGDIVLLFGDEFEALTHPYLAHAWAKRGVDLRVPAPE